MVGVARIYRSQAVLPSAVRRVRGHLRIRATNRNVGDDDAECARPISESDQFSAVVCGLQA